MQPGVPVLDSPIDARRARRLTRVRYFCLGLVALVVLAITPLRMVTVTGESMEPTLHDGQTYILDQMYWRRTGLQRGDIVVIDRGEENWIKRLVGLPGDRILLRYAPWGDIVSVLNATAHPDRPGAGAFTREVQLGPDEIFVIGDNLNQSQDSTTPQEAGSFKVGDILGIVRSNRFSRTISPPVDVALRVQ